MKTLSYDSKRYNQSTASSKWFLAIALIISLSFLLGGCSQKVEQIGFQPAIELIKDGQVFCRIHVEDIAQTVLASIANPNPGTAYNVCDNDPAPPQDVIAEAARLLNLPIPDAVRLEDAEMTPMARSFYAESKKVSNARIVGQLGVKLRYPDYKSGLVALLAQESEKNP